MVSNWCQANYENHENKGDVIKNEIRYSRASQCRKVHLI